MTEHILAPFYQALGHKVWTRLGALWIDAGRFSLITVPANEPLEVRRQEIQQLLCESGRLAAVFATAAGIGVECRNFWVRDRDYSLMSLQSKFRANVVRNHHLFLVRKVPWGELQERGLATYRSTMQRRGVRSHPGTSVAGWTKICEAGQKTAGLDVTGCFLGEVLTGFVVSWTHLNACYALHLYDDRSYSNFRASNVLVYNYTREMIRRPEISGVSMGRDWWPPVESISRFKRHAGYDEERISLAVILHPRWSGILESSVIRTWLRIIDGLAGSRIQFLHNLQLLDAAAATRL